MSDANVLIGIIYILIGIGIGLQFLERGERLFLSLTLMLIWPILLGKLLGDQAFDIIKQSYARSGKTYPEDSL